MDKCYFCERTSDEARILEAIYAGEIIAICEECAARESLPLIKKPTLDQLREAEQPYTVRERLMRISGMLEKDTGKKEEVSEQKMQDKRTKLVPNFHEIIAKAREKRGLSHAEVASMLGESEAAVKMVEQGQLPEGYERLIKKLEQFFMIRLTEPTQNEMPKEETQAREIVINAKVARELTIADLRRIKEEREKHATEPKNKEVTEKEDEKDTKTYEKGENTTQDKSLLGSDIEIIED